MHYQLNVALRKLLGIILTCSLGLSPIPVLGQNPVSGAFEGRVTDKRTGKPIVAATVQFINKRTGVRKAQVTDADGGGLVLQLHQFIQ